MGKKVATRRELLVQWRGIEEAISDDVLPDTPKGRRLQRLKEDWFLDVFNFLIDLPSEDHIWCGSWELMGPLLETFYNYSTDESNESPLKILWKRICTEMRKCTLCISQHHQAQDMYNLEYDSSSISPLLSVLQNLDEERIGQHLKEINGRLAGGEYIPERDNAEVVSVLFEVLTFPHLFDDHFLVTEFQIFIETIDDMHELTLDGHRQYYGVYALFFFRRRVRTIGHRLAGCLGKLREATELEPLQPFLKKCIGLLETEASPSNFETSRPRVKLERISVWLGIKALLGFLEPPALEEGLLERYPIFFSIVLNHISDDSPEFSHAVICLRLLFEMLGCKLWLRSTLSPTVMRNTLLSQCFHTQNEKSHKEIFDLFQPFLQSLEALQDGEHEQQRRHFIYFLLHQVTVSRNFSPLMRKKASQIALLIILRGYKMNPPCPPVECAHMWGPSLVSSLKDSSLENSLRQPAFDLIETVIVSDAAALVTSMLNCCKHRNIDQGMIIELDDEEDCDEVPFVLDVDEKHSSWSDYSEQSKITAQECRRWRCIPMLWLDVLVDINPSVLPISFSKAVFWARSRFSLVEPERSAEMEVSVKNWLSSSAKEVSSSFGWKVPTGSDDGGDGKESQNSMKVSTMCIPLIRTFKRLSAHFIVQMEQEVLWKQWIWEPRMAESLILLLLEPNDNVRQVSKCLLEKVSNTRGLVHCLQFLCSSTPSLSATYYGLIHALRLVQVDSVLLNFETLHHFFFVLCKLLKEGVTSASDPQRHSPGSVNITKFSLQGGFLKQEVFDSFPDNVNVHSSEDVSKSREKFSCLLSEITWPFISKCLIEGKAFVDYKVSQLTCARLLEILPVVFEKLQLSFHKQSASSGMMVENAFDFKWLLDLMDWGKSKVQVIARYWRQTVISLLHLLKGFCSDKSKSFIRAIEDLISCDSLVMDELMEKVSRLSVSLSNEASCIVGKTNLKSKASFSEDSSFERKNSASDLQPFSSEDVQILDSVTASNKLDRSSVIILSDDEAEKQISSNKVVLSEKEVITGIVEGKPVVPGTDKEVSQDDITRNSISECNTSKQISEAFKQKDSSDASGLASQMQGLDTTKDRQISVSHPKPKSIDGSRTKEMSSKFKVKDSFPSQLKANLASTSDRTANSKIIDHALNRVALKTGETAIKELVCDIADDPWELAVKSLKPQLPYLTKPSAIIPKRQVIQLQLPGENKSGYLRKLDAGAKRFKPPKFDDWYRPILEIDYFVTVGIASSSKDETQTVNKLKEVPMCFESPKQYVDIFRPLVLEEFKAQLHSSFLEMSSSEDICCGNVSVLSVERIDDFHLVRCVHDGSDSAAYRSFSENDLVLLTRQPLKNSSHDVHTVGKVERRDRDSKSRSNVLVIRFYLQNGSPRLNRARKLLIERSKWYLSRIMSITSQLREFHALSSINDIPILPTILKPFNGSLGCSESRKLDLGKLSQPLQQLLKSSYNSSQLQAINVAIASLDSKKNVELSLIQGPPGTGKTRTIVAIVSGLLASPLKGVNDTTNSLDGSAKQSSTIFNNSRPKMSQCAAVARAWQDAALARQLNENSEQSLKPVGTSARQRVLICAQSNAAVDELVARISSEGLYSSDGSMYKPYLVRVGNVKTVHQNSLPFFIDTLVEQRLVGERTDVSDPKNDLSGDTSALRASLEKLVEQIGLYEAKRANLRGKNSEFKSSLDDVTPRLDDKKETSTAEIEMKLRRLYEQKKEICRDLATTQAQERKANEESKALKHKLRKSILKEAEIVVATLSGCGGDLYGVCSESISNHKFGRSSENHLFDAVVIDEAAQALEPATLIPLQLLKSSGTRCIMVGDPKQLPATVLSSIASKFQYQCSMFERLQRAGYPVTMLTKQYRMHPEICRFPSLHFYDGKLLNGENMSIKSAPFHETEGLGPYVFFDVVDGQESHGKSSGAFSLCNEHEADAAVEVLRLFRKRHPSEFVGGRIGIITPYKCQLSLLRSRFSNAFGSSITSDMEFNTVDGFQGREVDILVLSTVRAAVPCSAASGINSSSIGFVADVRRMNVALTRAKLSLWIFGNARTLQKNNNWAALVKDAKDRKLVISAKMPYHSMIKKALKNPSSENSDYNSRQPRHSKVDITSKCAKINENSSKQVTEKKDNSFSNRSKINKRKAGDEFDLSSRKEDVQSNKRRANKQGDFSAKNKSPSSDVVKQDSSTSKNVDGTYGEVRGKESRERQLHFRSSNLGKEERRHKISQPNADRSDQESGGGYKILKPQVCKGTSESVHGGNQSSVEASKCSTSSILEEKDESDRHKALNQVDTAKDVISKRKQQREAVDALLSSALIPSKKSGTSLKPAPPKRSLSPARNASSDIKLPKPRKEKQGKIHRGKEHGTGDEA